MVHTTQASDIQNCYAFMGNCMSILDLIWNSRSFQQKNFLEIWIKTQLKKED